MHLSSVRSNDLFLKRYIKKQTLNAEVNNWDVELSEYNIQFKFIKDINAFAILS